MSFWATDFFADGFWADGFWTGVANTTARRPGFQDTNNNRNKRENRYGSGGQKNDTGYRLGEADAPDIDTFNNKNRNRFLDMA